MLQYLINTTEALFEASVLIGLLAGYLYQVYGERGRRITLVGTLVGFIAAVIVAWVKNKTKLYDTGLWNICIFSVTALAFIALVILDAIKGLRNKPVVPCLGAVIAGLLAFYSLPDVLAYPYTINLGGFTLFSTGFIYRCIGVVLGEILAVTAAVAVYQVSVRLSGGVVGLLLKLALMVNSVQQISKILNLLRAKRYISGKAVFRIVKFTSNHASWFAYAILLLALVIPLVLLLKGIHVNEPYANPAQRRKIKAKWRSIRRWSVTVIVCMVLAVSNMTYIKAYANREVELSPTEECEIRGDKLYIPFTQVEDGHLHRFAYTTDNGVAVRFIIIKKPDSSAYGVGLDACDICGETGYYERNGQVVCNRCDVVMNINTIGFKGGCNPKVIDYSIENGYIIVPAATLIEHESDFNK